MLLHHTSPKSHHQNQNIKRDRKHNPSFASTEPIVIRRLCVIRVLGVEWSGLACKLRQGLSQEGNQEDGVSLIRMMKIRGSMLFIMCHKAHHCIEILTFSLECYSIAIF